MNLFTSKNRLTDHRKQMYGYQKRRERGGGINQEFGTKINTPLNVKQTANRQHKELYLIFCKNL